MRLIHYDDGPKNRLVATRLPEGKVLFETPGCSDNAGRLEASARRCGNCPKEIFIVPAEEVGLEWRDQGNHKQPWGNHYRIGKFVVLMNT